MAINAVPVQVAYEDGTGTTITLGSGSTDAWATPTSGNVIIAVAAIREGEDGGNATPTMPSGFTTLQEYVGTQSNPTNFPVRYRVAAKVSDGTETSLVFTSPEAYTGWTCAAWEFASTDLATTVGGFETNENEASANTNVTSISTGSKTNTTATSLVIYLGLLHQGQQWTTTPSWTNGTSRGVAYITSGRPAIAIATESVAASAARSSTYSTGGTGGKAAGVVVIIPGQPPTISVDDSTIDLDSTITITKSTNWNGAITASTIGGGAITLSGAGATTRTFSVDVDDFLPGGTLNAVKWYTNATLSITDSDGAMTTTVQISPTLTESEDYVETTGGDTVDTYNPVSGAVAGDAFFSYWHTGNGVRDETIVGTTNAGSGYFAPATLPSMGRRMAYDVSGAVWLTAVDTVLFEADEPVPYQSLSSYKPDETTYTNLILWSNEFGHSSWTKTRASVVFDHDVSTPRKTGAWTLVEDGTASNTHYVEQAITPAATTVYTARAVVKASNRTQAAIALTGAGNSDSIVIFDVSAGTFVATSGTAPTGYSISELEQGSGWWVISLYWTTTSTASMTMRVYAAASGSVTFSGASQESLLIADAMIHTGSAVQTYIDTERATMASNKVLVRSYITHNLIAQSNTMSNAAWTKTRSSISGSISLNSNATGGWQSSTIYRLLEDATASSTHLAANTADGITGNPADLVSIRFVAQGDGTRDHVAIRVYGDSNSNYFEYVIDLSDGTTYSSAVGGTGSLHSAATTLVDTVSTRPVYEVTLRGWPTTTSDTAIYQVEVYNHNATTTSYNGTGTNGVYIGKVHVWNGYEAPYYDETTTATQPFAGTINSATINGVSATIASANQSTVTVTLPGVDEFDDGGTHAATRWRVVQDLVIGDGVTTDTGAITFEPLYLANFGTLSAGFSGLAPTGSAEGDDGYIRVLSGAGTVITSSMTFVPSQNSTIRRMVYDVSGSAWLAYTDNIESAPLTSVERGIVMGAVRSAVKKVVEVIT